MKSADRYIIPTDDAFSPEEFGFRVTHSTMANRYFKQKAKFLSNFVNVTVKFIRTLKYSSCHFTINSIKQDPIFKSYNFSEFLVLKEESYL